MNFRTCINKSKARTYVERVYNVEPEHAYKYLYVYNNLACLPFR